MKALLFIAGWLFVALASIGIFIPLLPTVPFLLLALACFDRSSPRFHQWLLSHEVLGEPIREWQRSRSIPKKSKYIAIGSMIISGGISLCLIEPLYLQIFLVVLLSCVASYLLRLPNTEDIRADPAENGNTEIKL